MGIYMTDERPHPREPHELALHLELDGIRLDQKIAALSAMHSQVQPAIGAMGADRFRALYSTESFVDPPLEGRGGRRSRLAREARSPSSPAQ